MIMAQHRKHFTNLAMHLLCTLLVFVFVKELLGSERRALERIVTLHPMKLRYRELLRAQLAEERLAAVRQQTDPLMRSLP